MRVLAAIAIVPAGATLYFFVFWRWFDFWRRHRLLTYTMMLGTFGLLAVLLQRFSDVVFQGRLDMPVALQLLGWAVIVVVSLLGFVADRQIGIRVRSFTPFFEAKGRIALVTNGAYGIVRHPIYAAGIGFQLGTFLVTGYPAVLAGWAVLTLGALWFTRQEERRLVGLLEDPAAYERYRREVPALFPFRWRRRTTPPG